MKEQIKLKDGLIETRELDANGIPNGEYLIEKGNKCYEIGTLKNGKKDGLVEKYPDGDEEKMIPEYYKDGKKQILLTGLLKTLLAGKRLVDWENQKEEEELIKYKTKLFVGEEILKEFFKKIKQRLGVPTFRESFIPEKKTNYELLKNAAQKPNLTEKLPHDLNKNLKNTLLQSKGRE